MKDKKVALVTGGSRGIGRAVCLRLSGMGYHILINYRSNENEAQVTLCEIEKGGGSGELLPFDVGNIAQVDEVIGKWLDENESGVEVLVNNAGKNRDNLMLWMKHEDWSDIMDVNLNGFFYVTRRILKGMLTRKYGRIINIVSLSGQRGMSGQVNYSAAKAGVIGATKALAQEVGKRNITVNAVSPGFIVTEMTQDLPEKELKRLIPMNRFGNAEEVAEVVGFLASKGASYVTGEVISVNGGLYT